MRLRLRWFDIKRYAVLVRVQREKDAALFQVWLVIREGPHAARSVAVWRFHY